MKVKEKLVGDSLDFKLAGLMGETPGRFLVLCLDGEVFGAFGTPVDTEQKRGVFSQMIELLNNREDALGWETLWSQWSAELLSQYEEAREQRTKWRPLATMESHVVVPGRSSRVGLAMEALRTYEEAWAGWRVGRASGSDCYEVAIKMVNKEGIWHAGDDLARVICEALVMWLQGRK